MLLVYLYLETDKKQYREGVEYGSARFGTLKEKKLEKPFLGTVIA